MYTLFLSQKFLKSIKPDPDFGPRRPHEHERWLLYKRGIIAYGGPPPDHFKLPPGETPEENTLPDWLVILPDGRIVPKDQLPALKMEEKTKISPAHSASGASDVSSVDVVMRTVIVHDQASTSGPT